MTANTVFKTSGSNGAPKTITVTPEVWAARIAALASLKPPGFAAITSWYNENRVDSAAFKKHAQAALTSKVIVYPPSGGSVAAAVALWKAKSIQGIISSSTGLTNFAIANPGYTFKMLIATGVRMPVYRAKIIQANLGTNLWISYATTETNTISFASAAQAIAVAGCVGKPVPGVQVSIIAGEVCVKTPYLASVAVDAIGWYHTGDLGSLASDGSIVLTGRRRMP